MKATMKNVVIDNENEALVTFARSIDFTELFDHVKAFASIDCSFYQPEITTSNGAVSISFMSDDIAKQTGVFAAILERCYIHSFLNGINHDGQTSAFGYWVCVSIRYEHKDGGDCGLDMVHAAYSDGRWEFRDAGQQRKIEKESV